LWPTDGVMTTSVVVGGVLLSGDQLVRMKELSVSAEPDFVDDRRFEVDENGTRDVLAGSRFREEGVERVVANADGLVGGHLAVRLDPMLEAAMKKEIQADSLPLQFKLNF